METRRVTFQFSGLLEIDIEGEDVAEIEDIANGKRGDVMSHLDYPEYTITDIGLDYPVKIEQIK
jgi:hypothetical protein